MYVILDARKLGTKGSAHPYLKKVFRFPDYYGNNLDALYDCLSELPPIHVSLIHSREAGDYFSKILSVFEELSNVEICYIEP